MTDQLDKFEEHLRANLGRLADEALPGPDPIGIRRALRRRTATRGGAAAGALVCALLALWLGWPTAAPDEDAPDGPQLAQSDAGRAPPREPENEGEVPPGPAVAQASGIDPLPVTARSRDVQSVMGPYATQLGAERLIVSMEPGEGVSFIMTGTATRSPERVSKEMEELFRNFDSAAVEVWHGEVKRLSLLVLGR